MRNKLFYLFGTAFLLCSIGTFTSCTKIENLSEEFTGDNSGGGTTEEKELVDLNGDYFEGGDNTLILSYNGEALTGKKATFLADEENATATIVLSGVEKDLSAMIGGLMDFKLTTNSPIPGEKEVTLTDLDLFTNSTHNVFSFSGKEVQPTRTITYEGKIKEGTMTMDITNVLANQELAGTWDLGPLDFMKGCVKGSPFWIDWDTKVALIIGDINIGDTHVSALDQYPNGLFTLLFMCGDPSMAEMFGLDLQIEQWIANLLKDVTAQPNGCMFATYSYSGDLANPAWSSEMSRNILRYYYGEKPGQLYVEANVDYIVDVLGGLLGGITTRATDPEGAKEAGRQLVAALTPALEKGFLCDYELTDGGTKMKININGEFMVNVLRKLIALANDPYANEFIMPILENDPTLAQFAPNVKSLLKCLPFALKYFEGSGDNEAKYKGECKYLKIGLQLVKGAK